MLVSSWSVIGALPEENINLVFKSEEAHNPRNLDSDDGGSEYKIPSATRGDTGYMGLQYKNRLWHIDYCSDGNNIRESYYNSKDKEAEWRDNYDCASFGQSWRCYPYNEISLPDRTCKTNENECNWADRKAYAAACVDLHWNNQACIFEWVNGNYKNNVGCCYADIKDDTARPGHLCSTYEGNYKWLQCSSGNIFIDGSVIINKHTQVSLTDSTKDFLCTTSGSWELCDASKKSKLSSDRLYGCKLSGGNYRWEAVPNTVANNGLVESNEECDFTPDNTIVYGSKDQCKEYDSKYGTSTKKETLLGCINQQLDPSPCYENNNGIIEGTENCDKPTSTSTTGIIYKGDKNTCAFQNSNYVQGTLSCNNGQVVLTACKTQAQVDAELVAQNNQDVTLYLGESTKQFAKDIKLNALSTTTPKKAMIAFDAKTSELALNGEDSTSNIKVKVKSFVAASKGICAFGGCIGDHPEGVVLTVTKLTSTGTPNTNTNVGAAVDTSKTGKSAKKFEVSKTQVVKGTDLEISCEFESNVQNTCKQVFIADNTGTKIAGCSETSANSGKWKCGAGTTIGKKRIYCYEQCPA